MALSTQIKIHTLIMREFQEYRNSLVITPLVVGGLLVAAMLISVLFANRIAIIGDGLMGVLSGEEAQGISLQIQVDGEGDTTIINDEVTGGSGDAEPLQQLVIRTAPEELPEETWNFSQEWKFTPPHRENRHPQGDHTHELDSLNPILMGVNNLFIFIMFLVSVNYLLGCLYTDRKDRSILFWKSMPVSEVQEVLSKLTVALILVPLVFLAASMATQVLTALAAMLLVWRMDGAPMEFVLGNIQFGSLIMNQVGGSIVWALWMVPTYAWFMLASAASKRSPFLLAFAIPIGLAVAEEIIIGTHYILGTVGNHVPHLIDGNDSQSLGLYVYGPVWSQLDYVGMVMGFGFGAAALAGAVWMRRYRFET